MTLDDNSGKFVLETHYHNCTTEIIKAKNKKEIKEALEKARQYKPLHILIQEYLTTQNPYYLLKAFVHADIKRLKQEKIVMDHISNAIKKWWYAKAIGENKTIDYFLNLKIGKGEKPFFKRAEIEHKKMLYLEEMFKLQKWHGLPIEASALVVSKKHNDDLSADTLISYFYRAKQKKESFFDPDNFESVNLQLIMIPAGERKRFLKTFP